MIALGEPLSVPLPNINAIRNYQTSEGSTICSSGITLLVEQCYFHYGNIAIFLDHCDMQVLLVKQYLFPLWE